MNISYSSGGVDYIESGGTITETNPSLTSLSDDFLLGLSKLRVWFQNTGVDFTRLDMVITDGSKKATVRNVPYTRGTRLSFNIRTVDHTVDTSTLTLEADTVGSAGVEFIFYEGWDSQQTVMADTGVISASVCEYVAPSLSDFDMYRSNSTGGTTGDLEYGAYTITCNASEVQAAAVNYPSLLANAVETVITFTRNGTDYENDIGASGSVLTSGGTALQLGSEETFTVTATLTDGINTVTMSDFLSANYAIFNANSTKNGIAFGKYATQTGFDCNMDAEFRKAVQIDGALTLGTSPFEILWVNSNPSASFSSGNRTMSRAVTEGEMVVCFYKHLSTADLPNMQAFGWVGVVDVRLQIGIATSNNIGIRTLTFTAGSNKFNASNCTYNNANSNGTCVPVFVAALKNMDITSAMLSAWHV